MKKFFGSFSKASKVVALILCAAIILGGSIGLVAYAVDSGNKTENEKNNTLNSGTGVSDEKDDKIIKDETVYVLAGADGKVEKIIVSDWIKNALNSTSVSDRSELSDIENVKGDETYTVNGDNMKVWDAKGNDIYYRGNIQKELPVGITVSYKLDGKTVSASELAGKSGKVTIRFDYKNNQYRTVEIDGKEEKIYVPFVMLTGMLLDNDVFSNVEVSNGKLVSDGDRSFAVGFALPGMQSNLGIDPEKFTFPDHVEITADVKDFKMTNTVTIASNELFNILGSDREKFDFTDDINDTINKLTDAMEQLTDGSSKLYAGLCTLLDKSGELIDGINKLADGAAKLKEGSSKLESGSAELADGAGTLAAGLEELAKNNQKVTDGSKQVFESLLSTAESQIKAAGLSVNKLTIENYSDELDKVIASLAPSLVKAEADRVALEKVTAEVNKNKAAVTAAVTEAVKEGVTEKVTAQVRLGVEDKVLESLGMTRETYEAGVKAGLITDEQQAQIKAAVDLNMESDEVKALIEANVSAQMESDAVKAMIAAETDKQIKLLIEQNMSSEQVISEIKAACEKAEAGRQSIIALKSQLKAYNEFYDGLAEYTDGVASAADGAGKLNAGATALKDGSAELAAGMNELYNGILELKNGAPALKDGVTELRDGSQKLFDGIKEFDREAVSKLVDVVKNDIGGFVTRLKACADVSEDYRSFAGISDDMSGRVKFIYRTGSISAK